MACKFCPLSTPFRPLLRVQFFFTLASRQRSHCSCLICARTSTPASASSKRPVPGSAASSKSNSNLDESGIDGCGWGVWVLLMLVTVEADGDDTPKSELLKRGSCRCLSWRSMHSVDTDNDFDSGLPLTLYVEPTTPDLPIK